MVNYYNLEKDQKLTGTFRFEGTVTPRGANAAIAGVTGGGSATAQSISFPSGSFG